MSEMFVDSLRGRIRAMNHLWQLAAADLTLEQVNHHERSGVLPLAFSFSHCVRLQDSRVSRYFLGEATLWEQGGWAERIGVTVEARGVQESVEEMEQLRFGDWNAWRDYQSQVIAQTERVLDSITEAELAEVCIAAAPADSVAFSSLAVGAGNPIRKLEVLECFVFQHGIRHLGELEHARALVGLKGVSLLGPQDSVIPR